MFSSHDTINLEIGNRKVISVRKLGRKNLQKEKSPNTCNNTRLNTPWVKNEVSREMKKYFYSNETTTYQTFWVTVKVHKVQCRSCADVYK